jgi:hypothetical protein
MELIYGYLLSIGKRRDCKARIYNCHKGSLFLPLSELPKSEPEDPKETRSVV